MKIIFHIKQIFKLKHYFIICAILFIISILTPGDIVMEHNQPYKYEYGLLHPWISIYQQTNMGTKYITPELINNNIGISFAPFAIFYDGFLFYFIYIGIVMLRKKLSKNYEPK